MRTTTFIVAALTAACINGILTAPAHAADPSADEIMKRNFFVTKVATLSADASMALYNDTGGVRERQMTVLSKLQDNGVDSRLVIRFDAPADIRGTAFMQVEHAAADDDLWIYLPALKKSRRLVANNKKDSFVGSDFAYGDILPPRVDLYRHSLLRAETVDGHDCYVIESVPKDATVQQSSGYARKLTWVAKDSFLEAKVEYYDEGGRLLKTQTVTDARLVDKEHNHWLAGRREMVNHISAHKTVFALAHIDVGKAVPDSAFSTRAIERE
jgi:hypothetical protein